MDFPLSSPSAVATSGPSKTTFDAKQSAGLDNRAMETIRSLDSRSFGFLDFHQNGRGGPASTSSSIDTSYISREFIRQGISKLQEDLGTGPQADMFQSNIYCRLGHLHLLLEEYHQALSAYQHYQQLNPVESATNSPVIYGLGLIYFHMNSYKWAIECFTKVLSQCSNFARAGEIHLRLGVMFKTKGDYITSMDQFQKALTITGPASFSRLETQFHIGHIHYLQGHYSIAREAFEGILATKSVPNFIRAMTLKQLGWLYHTVPGIAGPGEDPNTKATELLKLAVGADAVSSQAWYFLGRCHAAQGRAREAFLAYQQAVSKAVDDDQADIWCSIGILYHNMGQPKDSLQAYLCALYLDPKSLKCWSNMGCLYEAVSQPMDALLCYRNAVSYYKKCQVSADKCPDYVFSRVANLEQYLSLSGSSLLHQPRSLPSLLEAWHTLVPANIKQRRIHTELPLLQLPNMSSPSPSLPMPDFGSLPFSSGLSPSPTNTHPQLGLPPPAKKFKGRMNKNKDPIIIKNMQDSWVVPGISTTGQQVPNFSQFSPSNLQSMLQQPPQPQHSPIPFAATPILGMGNESGTLHRMESGHTGMGFTISVEDPIIGTDSPTHSDVDMRLGSLSSSGASVSGSIQDLSLSASHCSSVIGTNHCHSSNMMMTATDSIQSLKNPITLDNAPPPLPGFVSSSATATSTTADGHNTFPIKNASTSNHLHGDSMAATSLIAKPPSMLTDHRDLHHNPSSSLSGHDPTLLAASSVHQVETLPNKFNGAGSSFPSAPSSQPFPPPSPLSGSGNGGALSSNGRSFFSHPQEPSSSLAYNHYPHGSIRSLHGLDISLPGSHPSHHFAASPYPRMHPTSSSTELHVGSSALFASPNAPLKPGGTPQSSSHLSVPAIHIDSELARVDEYMQRYLNESHSQESLKNGTCSAAILDATREHDKLISQVLLMSPKHMDDNYKRRSSGVTTAAFLSMLEETGTNDRGLPSPAPAASENGGLLPGQRPTSKEKSTELTLYGLNSPLQQHHQHHHPTFATNSTLTSSATSNSRRHLNSSSSTASTPTSEASPLMSQCQTNVHDHHREANFSDTSSGVSSAGTKFSTTTSCSSGQSSPIGSSSPRNLLSPSSSPSPTQEEKFSYPSVEKNHRKRFVSQSTPSSPDGLVDQIYEPFPALSSDEGEYMIESPDLRPPPPPKTKGKIDLRPKVPIYEVLTKEDVMSEKLHALCCAHDVPICMVRGIANVLDFDLELFSSESLVKTCGDQEIEVRIQVQQAADENTDSSGRKQIWRCESSRSKTTIEEYAEYQKTFSEDEVVEGEPSSGDDDSVRPQQRKAQRKSLEFGTNVDLSDDKVWSRQLEEISKLPKFLRVHCPEGNFLSHIGHTILGMNSVQLYMKVPGARTPGHQENNNFCSVNINIGPGDCEWFAVHNKYWGVFHRLCEKHKVNFLVGSWWPVLNELYDLKVPVYRFTQYKGDLVWLNPGTVHWVQANRVCNNIAWNAGPLTAHQFRMSWERYRWNKVQRVRSIVPMIHLTWNLVKMIKIFNETLYQQLRSLMETSLAQCRRLLAHLKKAGIPIVWHGRVDDEPAPCCNNCLEEVFNVLFVLTNKGEYLVYCHRCATAMRKSFTVLQQYHIEELEEILASFKLHSPRQIHST